jgi:hypothetical protein
MKLVKNQDLQARLLTARIYIPSRLVASSFDQERMGLLWGRGRMIEGWTVGSCPPAD